MQTTYVTRKNFDGLYIQTIDGKVVQTIGGQLIQIMYVIRMNKYGQYMYTK